MSSSGGERRGIGQTHKQIIKSSCLAADCFSGTLCCFTHPVDHIFFLALTLELRLAWSKEILEFQKTYHISNTADSQISLKVLHNSFLSLIKAKLDVCKHFLVESAKGVNP